MFWLLFPSASAARLAETSLLADEFDVRVRGVNVTALRILVIPETQTLGCKSRTVGFFLETFQAFRNWR
jgi:hypothetical protein